MCFTSPAGAKLVLSAEMLKTVKNESVEKQGVWGDSDECMPDKISALSLWHSRFGALTCSVERTNLQLLHKEIVHKKKYF